MNKHNDTLEKLKGFTNIEGDDAILTDSKLTEFVFDNCDIFFTDTNV